METPEINEQYEAQINQELEEICSKKPELRPDSLAERAIQIRQEILDKIKTTQEILDGPEGLIETTRQEYITIVQGYGKIMCGLQGLLNHYAEKYEDIHQKKKTVEEKLAQKSEDVDTRRQLIVDREHLGRDVRNTFRQCQQCKTTIELYCFKEEQVRTCLRYLHELEETGMDEVMQTIESKIQELETNIENWDEFTKVVSDFYRACTDFGLENIVPARIEEKVRRIGSYLLKEYLRLQRHINECLDQFQEGINQCTNHLREFLEWIKEGDEDYLGSAMNDDIKSIIRQK